VANNQTIIHIPYTIVDFNEDMLPMLRANFDELARKLGNIQAYTNATLNPLIENISLMDVRNMLMNSRGDFETANWQITAGIIEAGGIAGEKGGQSGDYYFALSPGLGGASQMEQILDVKNIDHRDYYVVSGYRKVAAIQKGPGALAQVKVTLTFQDETTQVETIDMLA